MISIDFRISCLEAGANIEHGRDRCGGHQIRDCAHDVRAVPPIGQEPDINPADDSGEE